MRRDHFKHPYFQCVLTNAQEGKQGAAIYDVGAWLAAASSACAFVTLAFTAAKELGWASWASRQCAASSDSKI